MLALLLKFASPAYVAVTDGVPAPSALVVTWAMPAVSGTGFDGDPLLVRLEQVRKPESVERVEGKLVLRDLPSCPVVDLPVLETESIQWVVRSSENTPVVVGPVDADAFAPFAAARYS